MDKRSNDDVGIYNETSNTAGGINTPPDREDKAATDPVSDVVEEIMDNISGEHPTGPSSEKPSK
ncbi:hypothetical protein [Paenibacillus sp. UNC499MF]|uniref:hypothetical protein n=1 Tax=Paenibacillus sp. UNC499MF TaxID=1502751 RepID=UPI0008A09955|nr:hypothetical protein [Paenibacillus sp. UNC499MF]SEF52851.1 hypothetical protein SAMN02799616_00370 [Paenibacillus sp. UNC499MF]